jgi:chromosome segregation ATPase
MDEDTANELEGIQGQLTSLLARKRKRQVVDLEDEVKSLEESLALLGKEYLDATAQSVEESENYAELPKKNSQLQKDHKQLQVEIQWPATSSNHERQDLLEERQELLGKLYELERANSVLRAKLHKLRKCKIDSKKAISIIKEDLSQAFRAVSGVEDGIGNDSFSCRLACR